MIKTYSGGGGGGGGVVDRLFKVLFQTSKMTNSKVPYVFYLSFFHKFAAHRGTQVDNNMVPLADISASGDHKNCHTQAMYTGKQPWLCK